MRSSTTDNDLSPVVGHAPSIAGAIARRVADSPVARSAGHVPAVVRRGVDFPVVRGPISSGVEAARRDARAGVAVARDMVRSAPRDAVTVGRAGIAVARAARPVVRTVSDRAFAGIPTTDDLARMGANAVANFAARVMSGEFLDFSAWKKFAKYRLPFEP